MYLAIYIYYGIYLSLRFFKILVLIFFSTECKLYRPILRKGGGVIDIIGIIFFGIIQYNFNIFINICYNLTAKGNWNLSNTQLAITNNKLNHEINKNDIHLTRENR